MTYDKLLARADAQGLIVKEKPLVSGDGRIYRNRIAIRNDIETRTEKACVLAEELGHYNTGVGCAMDLNDHYNAKQERQARLWAADNRIGLTGLIRAYEHGCVSCFEVADYLEVTEPFLRESIEIYRNKYGVCVPIDNYVIYFEPKLAVAKLLE